MKYSFIPRFICTALIAGTSVYCANALTVDDYCSPRQTAPVRIKEMRPLNGGLTYAAISEDGKSIEVFDYKTGKKVSTLFDINTVKGDIKIDSFDCGIVAECFHIQRCKVNELFFTLQAVGELYFGSVESYHSHCGACEVGKYL